VNDDDNNNITVASFDDAVLNRYACTRYQRYDGNYEVPKQLKLKTASKSDPEIVKLAREALDLSTRAPTGFNAQPYKLLLVESIAAKKALSKYCIGRNRDRVLDSDCTIVFLADRQAMSSWKDYKTMLLENDSSGRNRSKTTLVWLKLRVLIGLFSNGIPLPKIIAGPISFGIRFAMRVFSWFSRSKLLVPTLSSPECWSQKNTMLVAMSYMLGCSARGLDTTPMEGYLSWGIRSSLKIPRRYTIPLVVSTGRAYTASAVTTKDEEDDAGISHGTTPDTATPRFPIESVVYENGFP
jgi:nitroreductase